MLNVFLDVITKLCKIKTKLGMWKMRPIFLQTLLYADKIVLIAGTTDRLQHAVAEWHEELEKKRMIMHIEKK